MRVLETGSPVVHEVADDMPLCYVFQEKSEGRTPDPEDWETGEEPVIPGPYPLRVTCPECLQVMHS